MKIFKVLLILICTLWGAPSMGADKNALFREDFKDLVNWEPFYFPKIKKHTSYTISSEGGRNYLQCTSEASASALIHKTPFNVNEYSRISWRWKVDNVYRKSNSREKSGDDYPIRVYVLFQYDPEKAGIAEKLKYAAAKALYGNYPPHSTLNYVWASKENEMGIIISPYTDRSRIIVLERGPGKAGQWIDESANIIEDYKKAFHKLPPAIARIAVMNDSDDTGERSRSYLEFLEVFQ